MPKTPARRVLRFETLDAALVEIDRLVAAEHDGTLTSAGRWTLGQALGHLAAWADYGYDGYPAALHVPWLIALAARAFRGVFVRRPMPAGVRIGSAGSAGTFGTEAMSTESGLARVRSAYARVLASPPAHPSPLLGPLTHAQWIALQLRHAELHLGCFQSGATR